MLLASTLAFCALLGIFTEAAALIPAGTRSNSSSNAFFYLHIAKTGGTYLSRHLPEILGIGNKNFISREIDRFGMEKMIEEKNLHDVKILCSFREPVSHFFSAFEHMQHPRHPNPSIAHTVANLVEQIKHEIHPHYYLVNFQSNYLQSYPTINGKYNATTYNLAEAILYMRKLDWFSINEEMEMSLKLLMCQYLGHVNQEFLHKAQSHPVFVRNDAFNYQINAQLLADIRKINKNDIVFYQLAVTEFWERVRKHKQCLNYTMPY
jgi:hypothetical protein